MEPDRATTVLDQQEPQQPAINGALTVPANDGQQLTSAIMLAATDPNFDVLKMQAMIDMKHACDDRIAEQAYSEAMRECQEEMRPVVRDKQNTHLGVKYATLEQIHESLKPIWLKHGFSLSSHSDQSPIEGHYRVVTTCRHTGGHKTTHYLDAPPDLAGKDGKTNKTPIQALGSTVSYVRRYLDVMIFDVTLVGEDRDGNRPRNTATLSDEQVMQLQSFMDEHDLAPQPFLKLMEVEKLGDIMTVDFEECMRRVRNAAARKRGDR